MYINGEQITSLADSVYPDQNFDTLVNLSSQINVIGRRNPYSDFYFNGVMSHFHLIDGTAYDASAFGETDATTGGMGRKRQVLQLLMELMDSLFLKMVMVLLTNQVKVMTLH